MLGKLHCIVGNVDDKLFDAYQVAMQFAGNIGGDVQNEFHIFAVDTRHNNIGNIVNNGKHFIFAGNDVQFPRLNFGKVQNVVNNGKQCFARGFDLVHVLPCCGREIFPQRHFRHADDRVHGSSDFVAHIGEEIRLHARCLFRFHVCLVHQQFVVGNVGKDVGNGVEEIGGGLQGFLWQDTYVCGRVPIGHGIYVDFPCRFHDPRHIGRFGQHLTADETSYHFVTCHNRGGKIRQPRMAIVNGGSAFF